jgi:hypothetical protein
VHIITIEIATLEYRVVSTSRKPELYVAGSSIAANMFRGGVCRNWMLGVLVWGCVCELLSDHFIMDSNLNRLLGTYRNHKSICFVWSEYRDLFIKQWRTFLSQHYQPHPILALSRVTGNIGC